MRQITTRTCLLVLSIVLVMASPKNQGNNAKLRLMCLMQSARLCQVCCSWMTVRRRAIVARSNRAQVDAMNLLQAFMEAAHVNIAVGLAVEPQYLLHHHQV